MENVVEELRSEIALLRSEIVLRDAVISSFRSSWSYRIGRLLLSPLAFLLDALRYFRNYALIKRSGLFDRDFYLEENPDVAGAGVDPLKHYLRFGWREGREPSRDFDGNGYLCKRPDVRAAGICPLVHFLLNGGRSPEEEEEEAEATDAMAAEPFIMPFEKVALNEHGKFVHEKLKLLMRD